MNVHLSMSYFFDSDAVGKTWCCDDCVLTAGNKIWARFCSWYADVKNTTYIIEIYRNRHVDFLWFEVVTFL